MARFGHRSPSRLRIRLGNVCTYRFGIRKDLPMLMRSHRSFVARLSMRFGHPAGRSHAYRASRARLLGVLCALLFAWIPAAEAGKVALLNCSGRKVRLCAYDPTDIVLKYAASQGDVSNGDSVVVTCNSGSGCKVRVIDTTSNCTSVTNELTLIGVTELGQNAYRIKNVGGSTYNFENVDGSASYFDNPANRRCGLNAKLGEACAASGDCKEGFCTKGGKSTGICCKSNCDQFACQSCTADGQSCGNTPYGQPGQYCEQSWQMCDGSRCVWRASVANGQPCVGNLECKSGFCADGLCCDVACGGACQSCNQEGKKGTCSFLAAGATDNKCSTTRQCRSNGTCGLRSSMPCTADADCASNRCVALQCPKPGRCGRLCR